MASVREKQRRTCENRNHHVIYLYASMYPVETHIRCRRDNMQYISVKNSNKYLDIELTFIPPAIQYYSFTVYNPNNTR